MKSCPSCRTKFDPTFTLHCPECGTSVDPAPATVPTPAAMPSKPHPDQTDSPPSPSSAGQRLLGFGVRLVVAVLALGVGAIFSQIQGRSADAAASAATEAVDSAPGEVVNPGDLAIGDCVLWPDEGEDTFASLQRLDCGLAHDAEVYALLDHPAETDIEYPGSDVVTDWGIQACYEEFGPYVGRSFEDAQDLDYTFFTPTELGWTKYDDRMVQCLVFGVDETTLTGSVRTQA